MADSSVKGQALLQELCRDALGGFDAAFNMVDGIACIQHIEFAVQDLKFQGELPPGSGIEIPHDQKRVGVFQQRRVAERSMAHPS